MRTFNINWVFLYFVNIFSEVGAENKPQLYEASQI